MTKLYQRDNLSCVIAIAVPVAGALQQCRRSHDQIVNQPLEDLKGCVADPNYGGVNEAPDSLDG